MHTHTHTHIFFFHLDPQDKQQKNGIQKPWEVSLQDDRTINNTKYYY